MNLIPRNCLAFGVTHDSTPSQSILMKLLLSFSFKSSMEWRQEFYTSCLHQFYLSTNKLGVFYLVSLRSFGPHCFRRTSFSSLRRLRTKKMFFWRKDEKFTDAESIGCALGFGSEYLWTLSRSCLISRRGWINCYAPRRRSLERRKSHELLSFYGSLDSIIVYCFIYSVFVSRIQ